MAKRRRPFQRNARPKLNLDSIRDTSETPQGSTKRKPKNDGYEPVTPVFRGEVTPEEPLYVQKSDVRLIVKV